MIILPYKDKSPRFGERTYIAPNATLVGDVEIGNDCSVWFGTVLRADVHSIRIGSRTNIQDNCTFHVTNGTFPLILAEEVTIGHGVIAHGCTIKRGALVGMGARVLDGAVIGEQAMVGGGALVTEGTQIPARMLAIGIPARVTRPLTDEEIARLEQSWKNYVEYKETYLAGAS